jgi:hypothetical protein
MGFLFLFMAKMHKGGTYMHFQKFGKLPPAPYDVPAHSRRRRKLYYEGLEYLESKNPDEETLAKAYQLIKESADMNFSYALSKIGEFYRFGQFVDKDSKKAKEIFLDLVERLNPTAALNLGQMYHDGDGVEKDSKKAGEYFEKAFLYASREAYKGDWLGHDVLDNKFLLVDHEINNAIKKYRLDPICDICHENVFEQRSFTQSPFREIRKVPSRIEYPEYDDGKPVIRRGFCCVNCMDEYIYPLMEAVKKGLVSEKEITYLDGRDDMMNALKIFLKAD